MLKRGFIHGLIITAIVGISIVVLFWLFGQSDISKILLGLIIILSWYFSARIYKKNYGSLSLLSQPSSTPRLFRFGFGASLVWAPFVSFLAANTDSFQLPIYIASLALVIPLATMQVVGALVVSNFFIRDT